MTNPTSSTCSVSDKRCDFLGKLLHGRGYGTLTVTGESQTSSVLEATGLSPDTPLIILLPVPAPATALSTLTSFLTPRHLVIGGRLPEDFLSYCKENKITCIDYLKLPGIAMLNAVATAEGALCEAMLASPCSLQGSYSLIFGFGKCGEILAAKLQALGSTVHISTRNPEAQARAQAYGYSLHCSSFAKYEFLFNTAPAPVIGREVIEGLSPDAVIIDIASAPGGTDFKLCEEYGIKAKLCLGLPGKYSPKTSAEIILNQLEKHGIIKGSV